MCSKIERMNGAPMCVQETLCRARKPGTEWLDRESSQQSIPPARKADETKYEDVAR